jgi:catechol 2,3-dioxygenase-like lactoylglutathione lyase family enzyme
MKVMTEFTMAPDEVQGFFNLSAKTEARTVFLTNEVQSTLLQLIEFKPNSGRKIRQQIIAWDYGLWDIAFIVNDVDGIYHDLTQKGFAAHGTPIHYQPFGRLVKAACIIGPDNVPIGHIERVYDPARESSRRYIRIADVAQVVSDVDKVIKFYCDILGLDLISRTVPPRAMLDSVYGLPPGSDSTIVLINRQESNAVMLEFLHFSITGDWLAPVAQPPNLGMFMLSLPVDDLVGLVARLHQEKWTILSGPAEVATILPEKTLSCTIAGPSGIIIALFEQ